MKLKKYILITNVSGFFEVIDYSDNRDYILEKYNLWGHILPKKSLCIFVNNRFLNKYFKGNVD